MNLLAAHDLSVKIGKTLVCQQLSFALKPGQCWGLLGANGTGKTSLLRTLAGLIPPQAGQVQLNDKPLQRISRRQRAQLLGMLPQDSHDLMPATVLETALIGRHPHLPAWQWESDQDLQITRQALTAVELDEAEQRQVGTLSGGERRRLALATLLTQSPRILLLDEPTNHLDLRHQISLLELVRQQVSANSGALMMSLHDINLAARFCDHLLLLFGNGETLIASTAEALTAEHLQRLYGHPVDLIEADGRRAFIPG